MSRRLLARSVLFILLCRATVAAAPPQSKPASSRIVAATNVTLRALPSTTAAAVAQLPLGTELTESGPSEMDRTWIRVKIADGRERQADRKPAACRTIHARCIQDAEPCHGGGGEISEGPMQAVEEMRGRLVCARPGNQKQDANTHARKDHDPCSERPGACR